MALSPHRATATLRSPFPPPPSLSERSLSRLSMGGTLGLRVATSCDDATADRDLAIVAARVAAWAGRLTRFSASSDLSRLNAVGHAQPAPVRATLAAVLERAGRLADRSDRLVDVTLLGARLAAEEGRPGPCPPAAARSWRLEGRTGRGATVVRGPEVRFDLDGVAKGWIADRALRLLRRHAAALVDADGDVAVRVPAGSPWEIGVGDPRDDRAELARFRLSAAPPGRPFGVATSGTSVHRWHGPTGVRHHLIDPRTGAVAETDVVQASVIMADAMTAEALAKAAVIAGSDEGPRLLERAGAWAAVLLLEDGEVIASPGTLAWLA